MECYFCEQEFNQKDPKIDVCKECLNDGVGDDLILALNTIIQQISNEGE